MSFNMKSLVLTFSVTIFGVVAIHMATDAGATNTAVNAVRFPDVSQPRASARSANAGNENDQRSSEGFQELRNLLEAARTAAAAMPGYTAILEMQEEVDDALRPVDRIEFKSRREPFSAYMRWSDSEQEALYVEGENDNRVIVKPSKGLAAIRRVWRLEPDSRMAKQTCRYPITDVGIENLILRVQEFYNAARNWPQLAKCKYSEATLGSRDVSVVDVQFIDESSVSEYCRSKFCFDKESQLLVGVENFGWTDASEPRLVEHYVYSEIEILSQPIDEDFSEANPAYAFVKR